MALLYGSHDSLHCSIYIYERRKQLDRNVVIRLQGFRKKKMISSILKYFLSFYLPSFFVLLFFLVYELAIFVKYFNE